MAAPNPGSAVSNSFDYVPVRPLPGFVLDPERCSARETGFYKAGTSRVVLVNATRESGDQGGTDDGGASGGESCNSAASGSDGTAGPVRETGGNADVESSGGASEGRTVLCRTETGDFADSDIRFIVHERGQLYLDVSNKPSITDFAADVRQVVISRECRRCPDRPTCCCCYVPAATSFFEHDERWLADLMRSLKGRVLDVGLGNVPYLRFLAGSGENPLPGDARSGSIQRGDGHAITEYHGVDPDPDAGAGAPVSGAVPIILHNVTIEKFAGFDGYFDTVLSLRSLNHFIDVRDALASVYDCLKPGGRAVFVESLALPLVRSTRHARECHEMAAGGFQHLRNWDSSDLIRQVEKINDSLTNPSWSCPSGASPVRPPAFEIEYHRPISPDTCDQWIVVLKKTA